MIFLSRVGEPGMRPYQLVLVGILVVWGSLVCSDPPQAHTKSLPTVALPSARKTDDATTWLRYPPVELLGLWQDIDENNTYEVVASAKDLLISPYVRGLHDKSFVKVTPDDARRFTGHYYRCPEGKTPYLVRAAYSNSVWGRFEVQRSGRKILIGHSSLGRSFQAYKTAFILNLDFEPEELYVAVSIAE
jgi:hypothetical protein